MGPVTDSDQHISDYAAALSLGVRTVVAKAAPGLNPQSLKALVAELIAVGDATLATLAATDPPAQPLACGEGCVYCCRVQVQVSIIEALNVAQALIETLSADDLAALKSRIAILDAQTHGLTHQDRGLLALACPLLVNERCSIYDDRSFVCRAANSVDAEQCRDMLTEGPDAQVTNYQHQKSVYGTIGAATAAGLADAQAGAGETVDPGGIVLELTAALHLALDHPDPVSAWQQGILDFSAATAPSRELRTNESTERVNCGPTKACAPELLNRRHRENHIKRLAVDHHRSIGAGAIGQRIIVAPQVRAQRPQV